MAKRARLNGYRHKKTLPSSFLLRAPQFREINDQLVREGFRRQVSVRPYVRKDNLVTVSMHWRKGDEEKITVSIKFPAKAFWAYVQLSKLDCAVAVAEGRHV